MKWLTIKEIEAKSKTAEGALKVSYKHWCQLYTATQKELREAYDREKIYVTQNDCGLCVLYFYDDCLDCPLKTCNSGRTLYRKAKNALNDWIFSDGKWQAWKCAAKALRDKLKELTEE